jgi:hypothetical protein
MNISQSIDPIDLKLGTQLEPIKGFQTSSHSLEYDHWLPRYWLPKLGKKRPIIVPQVMWTKSYWKKCDINVTAKPMRSGKVLEQSYGLACAYDIMETENFMILALRAVTLVSHYFTNIFLGAWQT